ncbi:uncharacterized protein N7498_005320 [Penicillium cinerascens]|uniref:Uncharacterized protein n=1 Tax=Penicillium cinerascens TaxID=70096 RepID=A0A9W9T0A7_9EURO|nr:uncharacterized protein N7498_005320 [Penicillium cinerascens]KAJ5204441.1 hypothetical protein N7498_005320 [Penicillium cinerascens]
MYPALIKHQLTRPSAFHITRLARASVSGKTQSDVKGDEAFFVNTTFPDDYEGSPLRAEDLQKQQAVKEQTAEEKIVGVSWIYMYYERVLISQATTAAHRADIYESLFPPDPKKAGKRSKDPQAFEQEPSIDEM